MSRDFFMLTVQECRIKLGDTGKNMNDKEIEKLRNNLYSLINQIIDNNLEKIKLCKKH